MASQKVMETKKRSRESNRMPPKFVARPLSSVSCVEKTIHLPKHAIYANKLLKSLHDNIDKKLKFHHSKSI